MECSSDFDRYYEELSTLFNEGNVIGFIGAGVSVNAGLPNWSSLIKECLTKGASSNVRKNLSTFSEQLDSLLKEKEYLKAASLVTSSVSGDINKLVVDIIKSYDCNLSEISVLAHLPFYKFITTNYDQLLQQVIASQKQKHIDSYLNTQEDGYEEFTKQKELSVLHLHGSVISPNSIVLDDLSYHKLTNQERYKVLLRSLFINKPFVFIGTSFDDYPIVAFLEYCRKYLSFYIQNKSYAFVCDIPDSVAKMLKESNITPINFDTYENLWKALNRLVFSEDKYNEAHSKTLKRKRSTFSTEQYKYKLSITYSAIALRKMGLVAEARDRIISSIIYNTIVGRGDYGASLSDLILVIEKAFIVNKEASKKLTVQALDILKSQNIIKEKVGQLWVAINKEIENSLEKRLRDFVREIKNIYEEINLGNKLNITDERLQEFIIFAVDNNASILANPDELKSGFYNMGDLLQDFLTEEEFCYIDQIEEGIRLGIKYSLSEESAKCLMNMALAAYSYQLAFYDPLNLFLPSIDKIDKVLLDCNVILPAMSKHHPEYSLNMSIIKRLKTRGIEIYITEGVIEEILGHLNISMQRYQEVKDDTSFANSVYINSRRDMNVFQLAYGMYKVEPENAKRTFYEFINKELKWKDANSLKNYLREELKFNILSSERSEKSLLTIKHKVEKYFKNNFPDDRKLKYSTLLNHDAELLYELLSEKHKFFLLSYDNKIIRCCYDTDGLHEIATKILNPLQLASFEDDAPKMVSKVYLLNLLPTGESRLREIVKTHYLSRLLNGAKELRSKDISFIIGKVDEDLTTCLKDNAIKEKEFTLDLGSSKQVLDWIDPKFIKYAKELDKRK
jgi:hypothetical protein